MRAPTPAVAALLAAALATAPVARADDLTPRKQALLLVRVLVYDRNLTARVHGVVRVAVAFRPGDRRSEERRDEMVSALEEVSREVVALGLPIEAVAVPYHDAADFEARLARHAPACLFVCSGLDGAVKEIATGARRRRVLSVTGSREMAEAGLAVALVNRGRRAGVVVNVPAAKAEGADLDAALLGIAEVLGSGTLQGPAGAGSDLPRLSGASRGGPR